MRIPGNVTLLGGGQIVNGRMENLAAAPGAPVNGLFYFDTALMRGRYYNGAWVDFGDIVDGSVTLAKLAANSVDASKIVDGSVGTAELADGSVTLIKHAANSVDASKIVDGTITDAEIAAGAGIAKAKLAALAIVNADVAGGAAIAYAKLNLAASIVNADIAAGAAIGYAKLNLATSIVNGDIAAGAAIALSKLATDPLARANHTGTQLANTISNFDTQVRTSRLDQMALPTAALNANGQKITNGADPTAAQDFATKAYVDGVASGLDVKASVRVSTTAALPAYNRAANVITAAANGVMPNVGGVALAVNDRLLLKDGAAGADNGIYVVTSLGAAGAPWVITRAGDADSNAEVTSGMFTFVEEGTNAGTGWVLTTPNPININVTALTFAQFNASVAYIAGNGLTLTGQTFDVVAADATIVVAADSIRVGTIQNANIANGAVDSSKIADGSIMNADVAANAAIDVTKIAGAVQKRLATIGDGAATTFVVNHALNNQDVMVQVSDAAAPFQVVYPDIERTDANNVTIRFNGYVPALNSFRVNIQG